MNTEELKKEDDTSVDEFPMDYDCDCMKSDTCCYKMKGNCPVENDNDFCDEYVDPNM